LGAAKINIGLQLGKPVLWLVLLMILVSLSALFVLFDGDRRSAAGNRLVSQFKRRHATLQRASTAGDHGLAVALFGLGALTAAGAASAYGLLRQPPVSSGSTSGTDASSGSGCSSGSDSSSSDGGGSGCGGCGGGGGD
jgi:hypothetical protein